MRASARIASSSIHIANIATNKHTYKVCTTMHKKHKESITH